jgi:hypothetical protein
MAILFPHSLTILTPAGLVDLAGFEIPPEAIAVPEERQTEVLQLLSGRGVPRVAQDSMLTRIRIASPQGFALPGDRAALLKGLRLGQACTITENLTNREALTVWTNALVWAAPVVTRLGTDPHTSVEYYSYQLEFIHTEA